MSADTDATSDASPVNLHSPVGDLHLTGLSSGCRILAHVAEGRLHARSQGVRELKLSDVEGGAEVRHAESGHSSDGVKTVPLGVHRGT